MLSFREFLLEYLTDQQRAKYSKFVMSPAARQATDHFFGKGNDHVREDLKGFDGDKSEVHVKVERHLGQQLDKQSYVKGLAKDKHGREVKIGRMIKDEKLRNEFANDGTRQGMKSSDGHYVTVVRGTEVAGQTNSAPDATHPKGHSWKDQSCKNVVDGSNKHYLEHEITHGTVVVRVHDNNHQEIYRATLQPHHNDEGHSMYSVDSEYGVKHPSFTAHAHDVADRLSGEHKGGSPLYMKHSAVYNDSGILQTVHTRLSHKQLDKVFSGRDDNSYAAAIKLAEHPHASKDVLDRAISHHSEHVRLAAIHHPNADQSHVNAAIKDKDSTVRLAGLTHPKADPKHIEGAFHAPETSDLMKTALANHPGSPHSVIHAALHHENATVRTAAAANISATPEHLDTAIKDGTTRVRFQAVKNRAATKRHFDQGIVDKSPDVREGVLLNRNSGVEHVEKGVKDKDDRVREAAAAHPQATEKHLTKLIADKSDQVREAAVRNPNATTKHIGTALNDSSLYVRMAAMKHPKATEQHIHQGLDDPREEVRQLAAGHVNATKSTLDKALNDRELHVAKAALYHPKMTADDLEHISTTHHNADVRREARYLAWTHDAQ